MVTEFFTLQNTLFDHLASTMNQYSNIVIDEQRIFSVQQGVQYQFTKFEFIDHMHTNEQDCQ